MAYNYTNGMDIDDVATGPRVTVRKVSGISGLFADKN